MEFIFICFFVCRHYKDVPYVGFYKLLQPAVLIRDPELIKDVLIKDAFSFHRNEMAGMFDPNKDPMLAWNPFLCENEKWKRGRNIFNSMFTGNKVMYTLGLAIFLNNKIMNDIDYSQV